MSSTAWNSPLALAVIQSLPQNSEDGEQLPCQNPGLASWHCCKLHLFHFLQPKMGNLWKLHLSSARLRKQETSWESFVVQGMLCVPLGNRHVAAWASEFLSSFIFHTNFKINSPQKEVTGEGEKTQKQNNPAQSHPLLMLTSASCHASALHPGAASTDAGSVQLVWRTTSVSITAALQSWAWAIPSGREEVQQGNR